MGFVKLVMAELGGLISSVMVKLRGFTYKIDEVGQLGHGEVDN